MVGGRREVGGVLSGWVVDVVSAFVFVVSYLVVVYRRNYLPTCVCVYCRGATIV